MAQFQEKTTVLRVEQFTDQHFRITLEAPQIAAAARPGQFVMIRTGRGKDPLLRRPFSIHQTSANHTIQVYFKVVGRGTDILARVREGEIVSVFGPLGRGYKIVKDAPAVLVGGGLGIAPLLFLAKEISRQRKEANHEDLILLGARDKSEIEPLIDDFLKFGLHVQTATDDGSLGHHGFVTELLQQHDLPANTVVYSCGPEPMMAGVHAICKNKGFACQVSVESVMACGMGACLGCTKPAKNGTYTHVCIHGPVYNSEELVWNI